MVLNGKGMKIVLIFLFFLACFSLPAQNRSNTTVYVPPVTGDGIGPGDNEHIRQRLEAEARGRNQTIVSSRREADYSLIGSLISWDMYFAYYENAPGFFLSDYEHLYPYEDGVFVLHTVLQDNRTGEIVAEQDLLYQSLEDVDNFLPVLAMNVFSAINGGQGGQGRRNGGSGFSMDDSWRNKTWYVGGSVFWTPRVYAADAASIHYDNFGFEFIAEYHFKNFFSVESGFGFAPDWVVSMTGNYRDMTMVIPLTFKFVVKPSFSLMLQPYTGIHFNISLSGVTRPPVVSWRTGFQGGLKAGPGILFIDPRFSIDMGKSRITRTFNGTTDTYHYSRYVLHIGIGYKYGF